MKWRKYFHVYYLDMGMVRVSTCTFTSKNGITFEEGKTREYNFCPSKVRWFLMNLLSAWRKRQTDGQVIPAMDGYSIMFEGER